MVRKLWLRASEGMPYHCGAGRGFRTRFSAAASVNETELHQTQPGFRYGDAGLARRSGRYVGAPLAFMLAGGVPSHGGRYWMFGAGAAERSQD